MEAQRLFGLTEKDTQEVDSLPKSSCPGNTYLIDWGSSGMKVYLVHDEASNGTGSSADLPHTIKIRIMPGVLKNPDLEGVLDRLQGKLTSKHTKGVIIGTAGFRMRPSAANATWDVVRSWNDRRQLFRECSTEGPFFGCRTHSGAEEAMEEYRSLHVLEGDPHPHYGVVSCGGASLQLSIQNVDQAQARNCLADMQLLDKITEGNGSSSTVVRPAADKATGPAAYFSWLASRVDPPTQLPAEHLVGGVEEMRAQFDAWLLKTRGADATNPCISPAAQLHFTTESVCAVDAMGAGRCLIDKYGSYITRLNGTHRATKSSCWTTVQQFLESDIQLSRWLGSAACRDIALRTPWWVFVSSFSRKGQLGVDVSSSVKFDDVRQWARLNEDDLLEKLETDQDIKDGKAGKVLTSAMLTGILEHLHLNGDSVVRSSNVTIAGWLMQKWNMKPGWRKC